MKIISVFVVLLAIGCGSSNVGARVSSGAPVKFVQALERMETELGDTPTKIRIEVARIAAWTSHPPDVPSDFEESCAVVLRLNPDTFRGDVSVLFQPLERANWTRDEKSLPGLSKLRIRGLSAGGTVLFELYIRERWATILYEGTWYSVDTKVMQHFINELTEWVENSLKPESDSPRQQ